MSPSSTELDRADCFSSDDSAAAEPEAENSQQVPSDAPVPRPTPLALTLLAALGILFALYFARAIVMPLVMAVVLALLLRPIVRRMRKIRMPDWLSAGVLLGSMVLLIGLGGSYLVAPARDWIENAPENLRSAGEKLKVVTDHLDKINETSEKVGELANGDDSDPESVADQTDEVTTVDGIRTSELQEIENRNTDEDASPKEKLLAEAEESESKEPVPVEVKQPKFQTGLTVFSTTGNVLSQLFIILVLAYFLLAWGDVLLNNFLHTLSTFREKRCTVELVHSVENGISTYLLTVTCINVGLGVAIGTAMWLFGMPNPVLWGVMGTLFNFVPYLGALVGIGVVFIVALLSFDSFSYAIFVPLTYLALTALEGNFITPYLLGRQMSLNPILIIVSLVFWSWMWGIGGAILAVPLLAIFKVSFDQFEQTKPLGILLSGSG